MVCICWGREIYEIYEDRYTLDGDGQAKPAALLQKEVYTVGTSKKKEDEKEEERTLLNRTKCSFAQNNTLF